MQLTIVKQLVIIASMQEAMKLSYSDSVNPVSLSEKIKTGLLVSYQRGDLFCSLSKLEHPKGTKHALNISTGEEKLGYIAFFILEDEQAISFSGIFIDEKHRGRGLSRLFIDELTQLAADHGLNFNRTKKQRKPLTCATLVKSGFEPTNGFPNDNRVFVGRLAIRDLVGVCFESDRKRRHFEGTRLYRNEPYVTVKMSEINNPVQVVLGSGYRKA